MAEGNKFVGAVALIAVIGLVVVAALRSGGGQQQQDLLSVSGTYQMDVAPDQAVMTLQVLTNGTDAKQVSAGNRQLLQGVMAALTAQGIPAGKIETTGVSLQRWSEYDPKGQVMVDKGYQQTTTLKVTVEDLTKVGDVLDAAVGVGANSVQDISFELKPATQEQVKQQALQQATKVATQKAQILASAAGAKLGRIAQLSENSYIQPYTYNAKMDVMAAGAASAPTPISPQQVTVQASVSMAYALE